MHLVERSTGTLPAPLQDPSAASLGARRVLLLGGLTAADSSADGVLLATPARARTIGTLPSARHDTAAVALGGSVYLFGGGTATAQLDEILRMLEQEFTPLEVTEESMAFSAHEEVGAGGHFLGAVHTLERFRECFYRPLLSSTANYERWQRDGGKDTAARASDIYKQTLEAYEEPGMDAGLRAELKAYVDRRRKELGD